MGGGTFESQNKILKGTYFNFVSASKTVANDFERGVLAVPMELDWGAEGITCLTAREFNEKSMELFGYDSTAPEMINMREVFKHASKAYVYRLGEDAIKASSTVAKAQHPGARGNSITVKVATDIDTGQLVVSTYFDSVLVDKQKNIDTIADLEDNAYVSWTKTATLEETAGTPLTGGKNDTNITVANYKKALDAFESYAFNVLCIPVSDVAVIGVAVEYTKRMREDVGAKFQTVVYRPLENSDYEGVVDVCARVQDEGADPAASAYWVAGLLAWCPVNKSCTNTVYDGEYLIDAELTQAALEAAVLGSKFALHRDGDTIRVLSDINSLITLTDRKNADFKSNRTIRVIDQYAIEVARVVNTMSGATPNDQSGRVGLWSQIIDIKSRLLQVQAIEKFSPDDTTVEPGNEKRAVAIGDGLRIPGAIEQVYITVVVS